MDPELVRLQHEEADARIVAESVRHAVERGYPADQISDEVLTADLLACMAPFGADAERTLAAVRAWREGAVQG